MPIVRIEMWPGRTQIAKNQLMTDMVDVVVKNCGCPASAVTVVLTEIPREQWVLDGTLCAAMPKVIEK